MWELLHFSDTHLFADASRKLYRVPTLSLLKGVIQHARQHHPKAVMAVVTGDLAHDDDMAYRMVSEQFALLKIPVYAIPGNHDQPEAMADAFSQGPVRWQRVVVHNGWRLILLNSSVVTQTSGYLEERELAFLAQRLAAVPRWPTLLAMHHPPTPIGTPWLDNIGLHNAEALREVIAPHPEVKGVLCGHVHQACDVDWHGVRCLCAPGTGVQLASGVQVTELCNAIFSDDPPGYRWVRLGENGAIESGIERVEVPGRPKPGV